MVTISPIQNRQSVFAHRLDHNAAVITDSGGIHQITPICKLLANEGFGVNLVQADDLLSGRNLPRECDIVLLDLASFDGTGQQACVKLRRSNSQIPIVVLSQDNSVAERIRGFESGADDFIGKPYATDEVSLRLKALLRRNGTAKPQSVLRYADITMDLSSRVVYRGEHRIDLSRREFSLLSYFVQNAETVLSRQQILEHVWRQKSSHQSNVVDVYVNYLRNKMSQGNLKRILHTVRGKGYILHDRWVQ